MKTKNLFFVIIISVVLLAALYAPLRAQECYIVMKVRGEIVLESTGKVLKNGDEVCFADNIIFKTADAIAVVHSASKGRYTLRVNKSDRNELSEMITTVVASALSQNTGEMNTRSWEVNADALSELKNEFADVYCVVGKSRIFADGGTFPMNGKNNFQIRYLYEGEKINKDLSFSENSFFIDKGSVYIIDGKEIDASKVKSVSLYYVNKNENTEKFIRTFSLIFPDLEQLKKELSDYASDLSISGMKTEEISEELYSYTSDIYGSINYQGFMDWINANNINR
ncbi:MAG: hypothetical protein NTV87_05940 [Ignavibacteriae bacterium]|nr:hypothetical protein [Ignavibacteriota bacterium]